MPVRLPEWTRRLAIPVALLMLFGPRAAAQQDSAAAQLRSVLRAFYFNLAHHDWEAIAADVLSAKVLASRAFPPGLTPPLSSPQTIACSPLTSPAEHARVRMDGDWAAVSVSRCVGTDEFRLVRFGSRWRFIYIAVLQEPRAVSMTTFERGLLLRRWPSDSPADSGCAARLAGRAA